MTMEAEVISPSDYVTIPPAGALALTVPKGRALAFFTTAGAIEPILAKIREEIEAFKVPDVKTKKGRDEIKSFAHKITRSKTYLESVGKDLAAEQKKVPGLIDASRRRIKDTLEKWHDEVRAPLTEWEAAEERRVEKHREAIDNLINAGQPPADMPSAMLRIGLEAVDAVEIGPICEEFIGEYASAKDVARDRLTAAIAAAEKREAEAAELARLRQETAEREARERDERIAREAAECARQEAERKASEEIARREAAACAEKEAIEAKARAEREEAARREREAVLKAEEERPAAARREIELRRQAEDAQRRAREAELRARAEVLAEAKRRADEAAAREADREHRATINNLAAAAFVEAGFSEDDARAVVTLIASRSIPNVTISY
jgi:hypothetical protein